MAKRLPMRDVVFLLPGIAGSVLEREGKEIWAPSAQGIWQFVKSGSRSLESLTLKSDDPCAADLCDGVQATRLVDDIHILPGLWKIDGYSTIRHSLEAGFELYSHSDCPPGKANYVEFPYDWRRDNRAAARRLGEAVERYLGWWRKDQNLPRARAILVAHSMGGLVARYWLEVLGGWKECRALITFGTPHRGSPKSVGYLVNGYKPQIESLTSLVRSCTSVYQLLPIYPMVLTEGGTVRVTEALPLENVDAQKANAGLCFHREIENGVNSTHDQDRYVLLPMVGTGQSTPQSASLRGAKLTTSSDLPVNFDRLWSHGDGTVPYASAIPLEMSAEPRLGYICEQHGSIQNNQHVLKYLRDFLARTQTKDLGAVRAPVAEREEVSRPGLSLDVEDFFEPGETVTLSVSLVETDQPAVRVQASIEPADERHEARFCDLELRGDAWKLSIDDLAPGLYRVNVRAGMAQGLPASPVTGLFEVGV
ncbi:MAG TPA: hypothetical protein VK335_15855 [Bryobacteraceae bacterium]|nr:hypothetical protein [Bryobacteraceae bacterium]